MRKVVVYVYCTVSYMSHDFKGDYDDRTTVVRKVGART
jgi:hypothetical protein